MLRVHGSRHRALAVGLFVAAAGTAVYVVPGWPGWASPGALAVTGAVLAAVVLTAGAAWVGSVHRRLLGAGLLFVGSGFLVLDALRLSPVVASPGPGAYTLALAAVTALAAIGVLLRRRPARWLALGLCAVGAVSSGLNLAQWMIAGVVGPFGWALAIWTVASLTGLASLFGRDVAGQDRLREDEQVWNRRDPLIRWTRAATIGAVIAVPMLVVYAFIQDGGAPGVTTAAPGLAGFLALAALLASRGLLAGAALLALGGVGLAVISGAAVALSPPGLGLRVAGYYLTFWLPAAAACLGCGVALVRSARRAG